MKTLSRTLLLSTALVAVATILPGNNATGAEPAISAATEFAAYISVDRGDIPEQAMLEAMTRTQAHMAMTESVLRSSIDNDRNENGKELARIRKTRCFTGDLAGTIKNLRKHVRVTAVRGTNLIRVSTNWSDPLERDEIVNAVADAIVSQALLRRKRTVAGRMKNIIRNIEELQSQSSVKQKTLERLIALSGVSVTKTSQVILADSLKTLNNKLMSLRLQKSMASSELKTFRSQLENGTLVGSAEFQAEITRDPSVAEIRSALLQSKIAALGDRDNRQLAFIQKSLEAMLSARRKDAAKELVALKQSRLQSRITAISESILAVGSQYAETTARFRDMTMSTQRAGSLQADIDNIKKQVDKLNAGLIALRIKMADGPLAIQAYAQMR